MNGTFNVTLQTPIGPQNGLLTLIDDNGALSGYIRAMGMTSPFKNGKVTGNAFEFSGILNTGFIRFRYVVKGTVDGDTIKGVAIANSRTFQLQGTRVKVPST